MSDVVICECFARDGLQHEPEFIGSDTKVALIQQIAAAGFQRVEATSYSNPKVVPQFADASEVLQRLQRQPNVFYKASCANVRAVERALADADAGYGANEISLLVSATDSHSERNLRRSREDQWTNIAEMVALAGERFRKIGTISMAFGCSFEGHVAPDSVLKDIERFANLGVHYITLGDTTGTATPKQVKSLFAEAIAAFPEVNFISHFHDTRGTGLVNCLAAYEVGVRYHDSALGGVGGHPAKVKYGGGHTGNVCTEDLVNLMESEGIRTGIDLDQLMKLSAACEEALGRTLHSRVAQSGLNPLLPRG